MLRYLATALLAAALPAAAAAQDGACPDFAVEGEGPDVLLVPGLASSPAVWDETVAALSDRYRFHRVTVPGFAGEPAVARDRDVPAALAARIADYVDCADLDRPALVGHSLGGFTGLLVARDHPRLLSRVVVVDALPFYSLILDPAATPASVAPRAAMTADAIRAADDGSFANTQATAARSLTQSAAGRERIVAWSLASDRATIADAVETLMTTDLRSDLAHIAAPVRVIYAVNAYAPASRLGPIYDAAYASLPDVRLTRVEDSFHFLMWDRPEAFAAELATALAD